MRAEESFTEVWPLPRQLERENYLFRNRFSVAVVRRRDDVTDYGGADANRSFASALRPFPLPCVPRAGAESAVDVTDYT